VSRSWARQTRKWQPFMPNWGPGIPRRSCQCAARAAGRDDQIPSCQPGPLDGSADRAVPWPASPTRAVASRLVTKVGNG
jgi:hypothetical protein